MKRVAVVFSGFIVAGLYAVVMYLVYGNLNWGSEAINMVSWFEPVFWGIAASGLVVLLVMDLFCSVKTELKCCGDLLDI